MNLNNLPQAQRLKRDLDQATARIDAFERLSEGTMCRAHATSGDGHYSVDLPPVPKALVVQAAQQSRLNIVAQLKQLGVEVS